MEDDFNLSDFVMGLESEENKAEQYHSLLKVPKWVLEPEEIKYLKEIDE